jgi:hypothetical protein
MGESLLTRGPGLPFFLMSFAACTKGRLPPCVGEVYQESLVYTDLTQSLYLSQALGESRERGQGI